MTAVVTGVGAVSSIGRGSVEFLANLRAGVSGIRDLDAKDRDGMRARQAAQIFPWSPQPEISPMKARRIDRGSQFAVVAGFEALRHAKYPVGERPETVGIALGTGSAGAGALSEFLRVLLLESPEAAPPFHFPNTIANAPASQVSLEVKFYGPNVTITQKEPSAFNAVLYADASLAAGRAEAMLAGGVDEWSAAYAAGLDRMRALKSDKVPSGIIQGEGCFVALLETAGGARRRGAPVLARLSGIGFCGSATAPYAATEDADAAESAMRLALGRAGVAAEEIDLVFLSRSGRIPLDVAEEKGLERIFGARDVATMAVKEQIGEMSAAGGAEIVTASLLLAEAGGPRHALLNAFGPGGNYWSIVLSRET